MAANPGLDNLLAWWSLDEASGNAIDAHSGGHDLIETAGTIASAVGKVGNARDFEAGDTEYFTKADHADLSLGDTDLTIGGWFRLESQPSPRAFAFTKGTSNGNREYWFGEETSPDRLRWECFNSGGSIGQVDADNLGNVAIGTWYFVIMWHSATDNQVGIQVNDGTPDTSATTGAPQDNSSALFMGVRNVSGLGNYWDGLEDEVFMYRKILPAAQKTWLYNSGNGRSYSELGGGGKILRLLSSRYEEIRGILQPKKGLYLPSGEFLPI